MQFTLNRNSSQSLYTQLAQDIQRRIRTGALPPGTRLPTVRHLAQQLGVTRLTIHSAYSELQAGGWVEATVGRGTFVADWLQPDAAIAEYQKMAQSGAEGASLATSGLADLAMYRGRYAEAEGILRAGIAADSKAANSAGTAAKRIMLAEIHAATGRVPLAIGEVDDALKLGQSESILVPAARLYLSAGKLKEATDLAATLENTLQTQSRAYAKIIDGNIAMTSNRRASAIDDYREAIKFADFWLARYEMGVVYARAGAWAEAISEFAACEKRRGEATALFLDDVPTVRYLAALPYWLGRAQEGLGQQAAARANYAKFLANRGANLPADPLVIDARKRSGS